MFWLGLFMMFFVLNPRQILHMQPASTFLHQRQNAQWPIIAPLYLKSETDNNFITMLHKHNQTTLLNYKRQSVYYPPDGTGRDSYIRLDNGGTNTSYKLQGVPELGNYMKFGPFGRTLKPASYTRFQKYTSDGTGRDKYVVKGHGGQFNQEEENSALLVKFRNTMRDGGWSRTQRSTTTSEFFRPSVVRANQELSKTQSMHNRRLSEPKRRSENYLTRLDEMRKTFHKN